jgi:hypothetical protein
MNYLRRETRHEFRIITKRELKLEFFFYFFILFVYLFFFSGRQKTSGQRQMKGSTHAS